MPITITVDRSSAPVEVRSDMFGANLLGSTNEVNGVPNDGFIEAVDMLGATRLRYPAGRAANEQITELDRSQTGFDQIREDTRNYLDWVKETASRTTLVVPALANEHTNQQDIQDWAELVLEYMGDQIDLIAGYEIGNEFWQTIDETEYGSYAADIANALGSVTVSGYQPEIWVQTANVAGGASNYKGGSYGSVSDSDAVLAMAYWGSEHRPDDWTDGMSAAEYYRSLNGYEQRVIKGNLELMEQLDADNNIANGFQTNAASAGVDGIIAHYYFDKELDGYDQSEQLTRSELKALDLRFATWEAMLPQDLNIQVTEWNVETGHWNWTGLKAAGVVVEQFQNMIEMGVDGADFWTIRHNTSTSIAGGNGDEGPVQLTPAGVMLQLMAESLNPADGAMFGVSTEGFDATALEVNAYTNGYRSVVYVTSHTESFGQEFSLDLTDLAGGAVSWSGRVVGIDASSSDGFSDNAAYDANGDLVARIGKRTIGSQEYDALIEVLGAAYDDSLFKYSSGEWKTYLPKPEDIFVRPGVVNPTSLDDFYFATETDVTGSIDFLSQEQLGQSAVDISFELDPYEVIEITIDHSNVQSGDGSAEVMHGGLGVDDFFGSGGDDFLRGYEGQDSLVGGTGHDTVYGDHGNDRLEGKSGNDRLYGGSGDDKLVGGDGNDYLRDENGRDDFVGGNGQDTVSYWGHAYGMTVNLTTGANSGGDTYSSIEHVLGSNLAADKIYGNSVANHLDGAAGNDILYGYSGNDTLEGEFGNDRLYGGSGNDRLIGGSGNDYLRDESGIDIFDGGSGNDTVAYYGHKSGVSVNLLTGENSSGDNYISIENILGSSLADDTLIGDHGNNWLHASNGNDDLVGNGGADSIYGGAGHDSLEGNDGTDRLYGGSGNDTLRGGDGDDYLRDEAGVDLFDGGSGSDTVAYYGHGAGVSVNLLTGENSSGDTYISIENVLGSSLANDTLIGDHDANWLHGSNGDDRLFGNDGNDSLYGGSGRDSLEGDYGMDRLYGGSGNDTMKGGAGDDYLRDDAGIDLFDGGSGQDTVAYWGHPSGVTVNLETGANSSGDTYISIEHVYGSDLAADHLTGDTQNNYLRGAGGNDTLVGEAGNDTLRGDSGADVLTGGSGSDLFVFHDGFGRDVVTDFDPTSDVLDFSGVSSFTSYSDIVNNHAAQVGADVIISISSSHQITLEDVSLHSLAEQNFDF
ncbi:MAG: calcium-binding protein [Shimia sp.]|nr:calcium-binding protein [Shimia sp.]